MHNYSPYCLSYISYETSKENLSKYQYISSLVIASLLFSGSIPKDVLRANMTVLVFFLKNGCNQLMVKMKLKVV